MLPLPSSRKDSLTFTHILRRYERGQNNVRVHIFNSLKMNTNQLFGP